MSRTIQFLTFANAELLAVAEINCQKKKKSKKVTVHDMDFKESFE